MTTDKMLLTVLVLVFAALAFRGYHVGNADLSTFAADSCKLFIGALLGMVTNRPSTGSRNGDTHPPAAPPAAPTKKVIL